MLIETESECPKCRYKRAFLRYGSIGYLQFLACPKCKFVEVYDYDRKDYDYDRKDSKDLKELKKEILEHAMKIDKQGIMVDEKKLREMKPFNTFDMKSLKIVDTEHEDFVRNVAIFENIIKRELNFRCLRCGEDIRNDILNNRIRIHLCEACRVEIIEFAKHKLEWMKNSFFFDYDPKIKGRTAFLVTKDSAISLASNYRRRLHRRIKIGGGR